MYPLYFASFPTRRSSDLIVALNIASFMYLPSDQIINQAGKLHYMTGGQMRIPVVFRCSMYYGSSIAAQHSDRPYPMFMKDRKSTRLNSSHLVISYDVFCL